MKDSGLHYTFKNKKPVFITNHCLYLSVRWLYYYQFGVYCRKDYFFTMPPKARRVLEELLVRNDGGNHGYSCTRMGIMGSRRTTHTRRKRQNPEHYTHKLMRNNRLTALMIQLVQCSTARLIALRDKYE